MRTEHKILILVVIVIIVALMATAPGYQRYYKEQEQAFVDAVNAIEISDVDLSAVPNGTYTGSCDAVWISAEVRVSVKDHRITGIELLKHENGRGKAAEKVVDEVLEAQSLSVDTIAGATASSKVILEAIEQALKQSR